LRAIHPCVTARHLIRNDVGVCAAVVRSDCNNDRTNVLERQDEIAKWAVKVLQRARFKVAAHVVLSLQYQLRINTGQPRLRIVQS
jgi:hypothetical protein